MLTTRRSDSLKEKARWDQDKTNFVLNCSNALKTNEFNPGELQESRVTFALHREFFRATPKPIIMICSEYVPMLRRRKAAFVSRFRFILDCAR